MDRSATPGSMARKFSLYHAIHEAAMKQRAALERDDFDAFYQLLVEREGLLDQVDQARSSAATTTTDGEQQHRRQAATLIRDILALDQESERLLSQKIGVVRGELLRLNEGRKALDAYAYLAPASSPHAFGARG